MHTITINTLDGGTTEIPDVSAYKPKNIIREFSHGAYRLVVDEDQPTDRIVGLTLMQGDKVVDHAGFYRDDVLRSGGDFERVKREMQQPDFNPHDPVHEGQYLG